MVGKLLIVIKFKSHKMKKCEILFYKTVIIVFVIKFNDTMLYTYKFIKRVDVMCFLAQFLKKEKSPLHFFLLYRRISGAILKGQDPIVKGTLHALFNFFTVMKNIR